MGNRTIYERLENGDSPQEELASLVKGGVNAKGYTLTEYVNDVNREDTEDGKLPFPLTRNRYVYALNNPLNYKDPTGHKSKAVGTVAVMYLTVTWLMDQSQSDNQDEEEDTSQSTEGETENGESENDYYKKGRPDGGNPREDTLLRKDTAKVKSEDFKDFLENKGENPGKWRKVMETWETPEGEVYERHYWKNGTDSYYHE